MYVIGFTNEYYTLWDVTEITIETEWEKYDVVRTAYLQNISTDINKVKELYPDVDIDLNLRGHSTFDKRKGESIPINTDLFNFGKYEGEKIAECTDDSYLRWFYDACCEERKEIVKNRLIELGYFFDGNVVYTKDEWDVACAEKNFKNEIINGATNGKVLTFVPDGNLKMTNEEEYPFDLVGYDYYDCDNKIIYRFKEAKENYYNGFTYYTPMINGKGKRWKGKTVKITDYTARYVNSWLVVVEVNKFEICK